MPWAIPVEVKNKKSGGSNEIVTSQIILAIKSIKRNEKIIDLGTIVLILSQIHPIIRYINTHSTKYTIMFYRSLS